MRKDDKDHVVKSVPVIEEVFDEVNGLLKKMDEEGLTPEQGADWFAGRIARWNHERVKWFVGVFLWLVRRVNEEAAKNAKASGGEDADGGPTWN